MVKKKNLNFLKCLVIWLRKNSQNFQNCRSLWKNVYYKFAGGWLIGLKIVNGVKPLALFSEELLNKNTISSNGGWYWILLLLVKRWRGLHKGCREPKTMKGRLKLWNAELIYHIQILKPVLHHSSIPTPSTVLSIIKLGE